MREPVTEAETRRRYGVPESVRLRVDAGSALAWVDGADQAVATVALDPDGLDLGGPGPVGRGRLARLESPLGPLLVREARKGGLLRRVRGRTFLGRWRPLDELVLCRRLLSAGVPVADAVGAVVLRRGAGWRGFLLVREVQGGVDLEALLYGAALPRPWGRRAVLFEAGKAVRRLHDEGVFHADLHPKNLLVDATSRRVLVLDLDRAQARGGALDDEARARNLARLGRAVEKHRLRGMRTGRKDALRFLVGYAGDRTSADLWLSRVRARLTPLLAVKTRWWRLTGQASPRAAPPPGPSPEGEEGGAAG